MPRRPTMPTWVVISCTTQEALAIYAALLASSQGAAGARALARVREAIAPRGTQEVR